MVQRVPAHLGETPQEPVSPWVVLAGMALLLLVACGVLAVLLNVPDRLRAFGTVVEPTPTRTPRIVTPAVTLLPATQVPPPTIIPTVTTVKYKVKSGDSLIAIAARYKVTVQALMTANGLKDETIRIGDELIIPLPTPTAVPGSSMPQNPSGGSSAPVSNEASIPVAAANPSGPIRHTVTKGDTLVAIAATYGSTVDAIRTANQLVSDILAIGQVLLIPTGTQTGAITPTSSPSMVAVSAVASPTPTSQFPYAAPGLQWPPDNQAFSGSNNAPTLEWLAPATLKTGEFYVLHLDYTANGQDKSIDKQIRQGTSYQIKESDFLGLNGETAFKWYVMIVSFSANASISPEARANVQNSQVIAHSPPSETRTFTWAR